jgi:DNA-binding NarL/FixJ family response regulator
MATRVLLVDDHEIFSEGLRALLERESDLEVVGRAQNGHDALAQVSEKLPDVVIMDLSMPGMNGIEACRRILADSPRVKVLCLSMHADRRFVSAALDAGVAGYLLKDCALEEFVRAVRTVVTGRSYLSPAIAGTVLEAYRDRRVTTEPSAFSLLTDREREVLQLLAEGRSTKQIADQLCVSTKTVGSHREKIMAKLDIHSVAGLTKYAIREGLTSPEE